MKNIKLLLTFALTTTFAIDAMDNKEISSMLLLSKALVALAETNVDLTTEESNFFTKHLPDEKIKKHVVETAKYMRTNEKFKNCHKLKIALLEAVLAGNGKEAVKMATNFATNNCEKVMNDGNSQIN